MKPCAVDEEFAAVAVPSASLVNGADMFVEAGPRQPVRGRIVGVICSGRLPLDRGDVASRSTGAAPTGVRRNRYSTLSLQHELVDGGQIEHSIVNAASPTPLDVTKYSAVFSTWKSSPRRPGSAAGMRGTARLTARLPCAPSSVASEGREPTSRRDFLVGAARDLRVARRDVNLYGLAASALLADLEKGRMPFLRTRATRISAVSRRDGAERIIVSLEARAARLRGRSRSLARSMAWSQALHQMWRRQVV